MHKRRWGDDDGTFGVTPDVRFTGGDLPMYEEDDFIPKAARGDPLPEFPEEVDAFSGALTDRLFYPGAKKGEPSPTWGAESQLPWKSREEEHYSTPMGLQEMQERLRGEFEAALADLDSKFEKAVSDTIGKEDAGPVLSEWREGAEGMVDFSGYFDRYAGHVSSLCAAYNNLMYIPPCWEAVDDPIYSQKGLAGDEVLKRMRYVASKFPDPPTPLQWAMLEASFCAMAALIYGEEFTSDRDHVLERNHWKDFFGILGTITPRKFGKTTCLAMLAIIVMICIPGSVVVCVSRTQKQAAILVNMVHILIQTHPVLKEWGWRIKSENTTEIVIVNKDGRESHLQAKCGEGDSAFI